MFMLATTFISEYYVFSYLIMTMVFCALVNTNTTHTTIVNSKHEESTRLVTTLPGKNYDLIRNLR